MGEASESPDGMALLFMDASHFVHGCDFLGGVWSRQRRLARTFSGRQRYNVLGAVDFASKRVLSLTNSTYIAAAEVCGMLRLIAAEYRGRRKVVVLDNARYQRCEAVTSLAAELGIGLVFLPPYSPNLNLIERLWKLAKARLRVRFYADFAAFKAAIDAIVEGMNGESKQEVSRLIGKKVQLFDGLKAVTDSTYVA